jgi:integrase/recombinase XerD
MSEQSIPVIRQRFLEDMRIKGLQPKTQTMYLRAMRDFTQFLLWLPPEMQEVSDCLGG